MSRLKHAICTEQACIYIQHIADYIISIYRYKQVMLKPLLNYGRAEKTDLLTYCTDEVQALSFCLLEYLLNLIFCQFF